MTTPDHEDLSGRPKLVTAAVAGIACLVIAIAIGVVGLGKLFDRAKSATSARIVPVALVRDESGDLSVEVALCAGGVRAVGIRSVAGDAAAAGPSGAASTGPDGATGTAAGGTGTAGDGATGTATGGTVLWELHMQDVSLDTGDEAGALARGDLTGLYPVGDERVGLMTLAQPAPATLPRVVIVEAITTRGTGSGVFDTTTAIPEMASEQPSDCEDA